MNIKILAYNLPNIKITDLKNNDFEINQTELEKIKNWLDKNQIQ